MSDWRGHLVSDDAGLTAIFREAKTVAVVGAKDDPAEPAHYVPAYLHARGYRILPVNPKLTGRRLHDVATFARVADLPEPVDVIEVFRRPVYLPVHADEFLALSWLSRTLWLHLVIRYEWAA